MCLILVDCENVSNSFEVNCSLLSEIICFHGALLFCYYMGHYYGYSII